MIRTTRTPKSLLNLLSLHHVQPLTTTNTTPPPSTTTDNHPIITPVNPTHLLRVCTILYQQQNSPLPKLHTNLTRTHFHLTHEFFLQVCNNFPYSWRPIYQFYLFTETHHPKFKHTPTTVNKMLQIIGKSKNIELFWDLIQQMAREHLASDKTYVIALKTLASVRELKKCVEFFHVMNENGYEYSVLSLSKVVESMCKDKLVNEAKFVVLKLKDLVRPNGCVYKWLIYGFCDIGDLVEASKVWNLMVDEGFEPDIESVEIMIETLFKNNKFVEGMKIFQSMRVKRIDDLGLSTYQIVINWMCKKGKLGQAYVMFEEMQKRNIQVDNKTLGSIIYGLTSKGRDAEAYKIVEGIDKPDVLVYHGLIKGLLKSKKVSEATQVFREMIKKGCEPTMHTYIMLLQGHLGKRGRKGEDPLVNFDTIFVGGLVKAGKPLDVTKYVERVLNRGIEVPRFDYNNFLHVFSNEKGVVMFETMAKKMREVGLFDLADIFARYGEKMATRDRRRNRGVEQ